MMKIKVEPGQEVIATLTKRLELLGVKHAAIASLIGAVDRCCISNMPVDDARSDILREYNEPFELSGTGEVRGR